VSKRRDRDHAGHGRSLCFHLVATSIGRGVAPGLAAETPQGNVVDGVDTFLSQDGWIRAQTIQLQGRAVGQRELVSRRVGTAPTGRSSNKERVVVVVAFLGPALLVPPCQTLTVRACSGDPRLGVRPGR
jgi:hypothetical protein